MKRRSIQDNLHLVREGLQGLEDGTEAMLINLGQSKAFEVVGYRFLATVLETARFQPEFRRLWDEEASLVSLLIALFWQRFANDITISVSRCLDIKAVKKAVARYKQIAGAKINFDKIEGLRLGA